MLRLKIRASGLFVLVLLVACQNPPPSKATLQQMEKELVSEPAPVPVPAEVRRALVPSLPLDAHPTPQIADEQRFDIAVNDVPARQFFMSLVDGTRYNMVVHPDTTGKISLSLRNVTIPEVIAATHDVYGFEFQRTSYGFQVLPSRLEARIFQINYLNIKRSGSSSTFVSAGTLQKLQGLSDGDEESSGESSSGSNDQGDQNGSSGSGHRALIGTQVNTLVPETAFWQELSAAVTALVGTAEGRNVVVNPQSGVVVVRALPSELREVETYLQTAQLIAQRQVVLEAKVLEVELSDGFQAGVNWAAVIGDFTLAQTGGSKLLDSAAGRSELAGTIVDQFPGVTKLAGVPAVAFGGVFALAVNGQDFTAFLEVLKTQGNVQVLSSPRISTMNNQKAIIKVGTDEFFVTDVSTTTVTGTATTSTPNIELTPFFSGIALDVTPQISRDGVVTLHIHPSVSEVTDQEKVISIGGETQTLPLARSTVRETDSVVQARSGQLVVIGGLMQTHEREHDATTPLLGEMPLVGALFRHKRTLAVKSELVILLRPLVINEGADWAQPIDQSRGRLSEMEDTLNARGQLPGADLGLPSP
ncbi:MAG: pilus (MSHA type) biogenesis protein MshL [Gammaproteobacteria bacterium]|nr:pilus (MSHA type) biogenesis protein MshL [Gammaproteobacteria bacterium]